MAKILKQIGIALSLLLNVAMIAAFMLGIVRPNPAFFNKSGTAPKQIPQATQITPVTQTAVFMQTATFTPIPTLTATQQNIIFTAPFCENTDDGINLTITATEEMNPNLPTCTSLVSGAKGIYIQSGKHELGITMNRMKSSIYVFITGTDEWMPGSCVVTNGDTSKQFVPVKSATYDFTMPVDNGNVIMSCIKVGLYDVHAVSYKKE